MYAFKNSSRFTLLCNTVRNYTVERMKVDSQRHCGCVGM